MFNEFPYTNYEKINLDWLLDLGNKLKADAESGAFDGERGPGIFGITTIYSENNQYYAINPGGVTVGDFILGYSPAAGTNILYIMKVTSVTGNYVNGTSITRITGPQGVPGEVTQSTINSMSLGIDETDGLVYLYVNGVKQGTGIAIGDVPPPAPTVIYGDVVVSDSVIQVSGGNSGSFNVRLSEQPTQNQTVNIYGNGVTPSAANLLFTTDNWNTPQTVSFTTSAVDDTTTAYVTLINSDPLMTETTVTVIISAPGYSDYVDTTIPSEGMHTVTLSDFDYNSAYGNYIRLGKYNGAYTNIKIPSMIDSKIPWILCDQDGNAAFTNNTTIQYVTFEDGVIYRGGGVTSGCSATYLFSGCTNLIGVSNMNPAVTDMRSAFYGCTNFKFVDNLDELINVTRIFETFMGSGVEYIQDLSGLVNLSVIQGAFKSASHIIKIFGMPHTLAATGVNATSYCYGTTTLTSAIVPAGVGNLAFAFYNDTALRKVEIYEDNLTTSGIVSTTFYGCSNLTVYCNANTTTHASLLSQYGSSTSVTIKTFGGSSLPSIVVWGDSTSSPNRSWIEWPKRLQTKLGTNDYLVKNEAVSGEWTTSTSARQGGNAIHTNAFVIPATTTASPVTLTTEDNQTFSTAPIFNPGGSFNPCQIAGIEGVISRDGANYYFTRSADGNSANVNSGAIVTSDKDAEFNASGNVMLVNIGHNSGWNGDAATLVNQMQLMVNHFLALGGTDYIITGPWSGTWISTDSGWAVTQQVNTLAYTAFGNHWLNLPADMAANCQTDNPGVMWTTEDLAYIAAGKTPLPSLTYDNTHPTEAGANSQMMAFYRKGVSLGYWT